MKREIHLKVRHKSFSDDGCQRRFYKHTTTTKGLQRFGLQKPNKPRQPHRVNRQKTRPKRNFKANFYMHLPMETKTGAKKGSKREPIEK